MVKYCDTLVKKRVNRATVAGFGIYKMNRLIDLTCRDCKKESKVKQVTRNDAGEMLCRVCFQKVLSVPRKNRPSRRADRIAWDQKQRDKKDTPSNAPTPVPEGLDVSDMNPKQRRRAIKAHLRKEDREANPEEPAKKRVKVDKKEKKEKKEKKQEEGGEAKPEEKEPAVADVNTDKKNKSGKRGGKRVQEKRDHFKKIAGERGLESINEKRDKNRTTKTYDGGDEDGEKKDDKETEVKKEKKEKKEKKQKSGSERRKIKKHEKRNEKRYGKEEADRIKEYKKTKIAEQQAAGEAAE